MRKKERQNKKCAKAARKCDKSCRGWGSHRAYGHALVPIICQKRTFRRKNPVEWVEVREGKKAERGRGRKPRL